MNICRQNWRVRRPFKTVRVFQVVFQRILCLNSRTGGGLSLSNMGDIGILLAPEVRRRAMNAEEKIIFVGRQDSADCPCGTIMKHLIDILLCNSMAHKLVNIGKCVIIIVILLLSNN